MATAIREKTMDKVSVLESPNGLWVEYVLPDWTTEEQKNRIELLAEETVSKIKEILRQ